MKSKQNEIFIFDSSKMLNVKNKHFKEKFDVLRMVRLVSSRYCVRNMQLHLVLFALFIYTIFKEDKWHL